MKLVVVRHGQAEPAISSDSERRLTPRGVEDSRMLGQKLRQLGVELDVAFVSPLVRARQTYEQLVSAYDSYPGQVITDLITPDSDISNVFQLLEGNTGENILLVSHLPLVSAFVANLCEGNAGIAYDYPMAPASVAIIEADVFSPACGVLKNLLYPPYQLESHI